MMSESGVMHHYHPVDQSEATRHQVVTSIGDSSILYRGDKLAGDEQDKSLKKSTLLIIDDDVLNINKSAKLRAPEIDISSGLISQTPGRCGYDCKKLCETNEVLVIDDDDTLVDNNFKNLNVNIRQDAPIEIDITSESGTSDVESVQNGVWADNQGFPDGLSLCALQEDDFTDYAHIDSRVYDKHLPGCVVIGTNDAVRNLLDSIPSLNIGTHGVIYDRRLKPSFEGLYEEGQCGQFTTTRDLGSGSYGTVTQCRHAGSQEYVRKVIKQKFKRMEVEVLMELHHPNITAFYGYILRDKCHEILMEFGGDSLKAFMTKNKATFRTILTLDVVSMLSLQGFSALAYMSEQCGILHLDIKPENVLVQFNPTILKLTDLGTSKTPEQAVSFDGWTPEYMAPEACQLSLYKAVKNPPDSWRVGLTDKVDVFAMSLTIHFMLTGNHAVSVLWPKDFTNFKLMDWRMQYIQHLAVNPGFTQQFGVKDDWPKEMRDLLYSGLEGDPQIRMSAHEAYNYINERMISPANTPMLVDRGLPNHLDVPTQPPGVTLAPDTPDASMDISLHKKATCGGKEIKLKLQRKIKRKSTPYKKEMTDVSFDQATSTDDNKDERLPNFNLLV